MKRVYVMDCGTFVKIGVSSNPDRRKEQLPVGIAQYYCTKPINNAFEIENEMHRLFNSKRVITPLGREYFGITFDAAVIALRQKVGKPCPKALIPDKLKMIVVGGDGLSESDRLIVEKLKDAIPKMSDFDKGYILGKVENMAEQNQQSEHTDTENSRKE